MRSGSALSSSWALAVVVLVVEGMDRDDDDVLATREIVVPRLRLAAVVLDIMDGGRFGGIVGAVISNDDLLLGR